MDKKPRGPAVIDALLFVAPGCAHCPVVLEALARLIKEGRLGRLEVVSVAAYPERAAAAGARSAPWTRIGPFVLEGLHTYAELANWVEFASNGQGFGEYYGELLQTQKLSQALRLAHEKPESLDALIGLLRDPDTPMGVKIGIGAMFEELADDGILWQLVPQLADLTEAGDAQTRADACHYLGLTGDPRATEAVKRLLEDENPEVREIAAETRDLLESRDS